MRAPSSTVDGATDYGDQGIFSNASSSGGTAEPAADTPFAPYYGIEMLTKLGSPGDGMVTATSGNALVRVHAVRRAGGSLDVLIDNEDPANSYTVNLTYNGFTPSGSPTVYTLGNNATSITSATQNSAVVSDGRALHADRHPDSRQRRHRGHRPGSARPAHRVRAVVQHLGQHLGNRHAGLAGLRRRDLPGRRPTGSTPRAAVAARSPGPRRAPR